MSRRAARPRPTSFRRTTAQGPRSADACPCGTGQAYGACCGRFHSGAAEAATAEQLMRSRYTAFAVGDAAYLLRTWHPRTRPSVLHLDQGVRWIGLEITGASEGSAFHATGTVTFRAHWTAGGETGVLAEHSRFTRGEDGGAWRYVDGDVRD
ncbi:YchJ family metal-binding protein [Streptomyces diastaticus]|uniref:YchJ family protein n=1 Tax=Streptomyces diastaticus TaxID=1956 RepID=UPI0034477A2B